MSQKPSRFKRVLHSLLALDGKWHSIQVEPVPLTCPGLPPPFHLARIAVVADLHLPDGLMPIRRLADTIALQKPDAIFLAGDMTNSYADFDAEGLQQLAAALTPIAPCFAVPGNHEWRLDREPLYRRILTEGGVQYLCDSYADWHKDGGTLRLYGMGRQKPAPLDITGQPAVVIAHRPEYMPLYAAAGWDLVVCGHAHGGHARVGRAALYAPHQGLLPKYTHGVYTQGATRMVVSRGLGNSSLPWRVNNPPHLPILILSAK